MIPSPSTGSSARPRGQLCRPEGRHHFTRASSRCYRRPWPASQSYRVKMSVTQHSPGRPPATDARACRRRSRPLLRSWPSASPHPRVAPAAARRAPAPRQCPGPFPRVTTITSHGTLARRRNQGFWILHRGPGPAVPIPDPGSGRSSLQRRAARLLHLLPCGRLWSGQVESARGHCV